MTMSTIFEPVMSQWMRTKGPDKDIVLSSRIRLARNLDDKRFPHIASQEELRDVLTQLNKIVQEYTFHDEKPFYLLKMEDLNELQRHILVEKHLISPNLERNSSAGATFLSEDQRISLMINEEDHIRIQCIYPGFQLKEGYKLASEIDDWLEKYVNYAFSVEKGYLTSCPTNVGTGLRASVMLHLPALQLTKKMNKIIPTVNRFGLVVRGIYGEGTHSIGNIFQISNQVTLGKTEEDIINNLITIVEQLIDQERATRKYLLQSSGIVLEDKVFRSLGVLENSRLIESIESAQCLSDVQLGIDLGFITHLDREILSELIMITQPALLQQYAGKLLNPKDRDIRRATLIREKLKAN
ncbi:MAG: protein arginine kinase [Bacillaceae bacterium]